MAVARDLDPGPRIALALDRRRVSIAYEVSESPNFVIVLSGIPIILDHLHIDPRFDDKSPIRWHVSFPQDWQPREQIQLLS